MRESRRFFQRIPFRSGTQNLSKLTTITPNAGKHLDEGAVYELLDFFEVTIARHNGGHKSFLATHNCLGFTRKFSLCKKLLFISWRREKRNGVSFFVEGLVKGKKQDR